MKEDTLKDLAKTQKTYWKFSQSQKGRSMESCYAEYKPGHITEAEETELDNALSFVSNEDISTCFMYGDVLNKLCFDLNNDKFKEIEDCPIKRCGNPLGEYKSAKLLVEKQYSLADLETIRLIFDMASTHKQIINLFAFYDGKGIESFLKKWGFVESEKMIVFLRSRFTHLTSKNEVMKWIDEYMELNDKTK